MLTGVADIFNCSEDFFSDPWCLISMHFAIFLLWISSLIPLWSESKYCMLATLLSLLKCALWPRIWGPLVTFPQELEKNVCFAVV